MHGIRWEKLNDDERQLAFEDLEAAVAEVGTRQDAEAGWTCTGFVLFF